jgi:hypothetical protein
MHVCFADAEFARANKDGLVHWGGVVRAATGVARCHARLLSRDQSVGEFACANLAEVKRVLDLER